MAESGAKTSQSYQVKAKNRGNTLVIKIISGSNAENIPSGTTAGMNKNSSKTTPKIEECKVATHAYSCSNSTTSFEKDDKRSISSSECVLQLKNNTEIVCKDIYPLNAQERKAKLEHYFEKKRARRWKKRINYA